MTDVVVIGGGVVGLSIAWKLASEGAAVSVVDANIGRGASWAAAGMLAPSAEARYGEEALLRLNLESARRYPAFVAQLEDASERCVGYCTTGMFTVAANRDDADQLRDQLRFQQQLGLNTSWISSSSARSMEPRLRPTIAGAIDSPDDAQVDNRLLVDALNRACKRAGVVFVDERVQRFCVEEGSVRYVLTASQRLQGEHFVLAAGVESARIAGLPDDAVPGVRPVKGEILRLRQEPNEPLTSRTIRAVVRGWEVYIVPRETGEVVVGATNLEVGADRRVTAGGVHRLLDSARQVLPDIDELEMYEFAAGLRPATVDGVPVIGSCDVGRLVLAYGHYRHGILLAPLTADVVAATLSHTPVGLDTTAVDPGRFVDAETVRSGGKAS